MATKRSLQVSPNVFINPVNYTVQISIDVDELPQLCNRVLGVRFMPVIIAVKNGIKFKQWVCIY